MNNSNNIDHNKKWEMSIVLLTLVCCGFAVLGLYSMANNSKNKKSTGLNHTRDIVNQFLLTNANRIKSDPDWINIFADGKPGSVEPHAEDWHHRSIFELDNLRITPTDKINPLEKRNDGFFLLECVNQERVDFSGILRVWKDESNLTSKTHTITLNLEFSWPAHAAYESENRYKEIFSFEIMKNDDISIAAIPSEDCSITKVNELGYSATINSFGSEEKIVEFNIGNPQGLGKLESIFVECPQDAKDIKGFYEDFSDETNRIKSIDLDGRVMMANGEFGISLNLPEISRDREITSITLSYQVPDGSISDTNMTVMLNDKIVSMAFGKNEIEFCNECNSEFLAANDRIPSAFNK